MDSREDILSDKTKTLEAFEAFIKKENPENKKDVDIVVLATLLGEFRELLELSKGFYQSALKNIYEKRILETKLEEREAFNKKYNSKHYDFILVESGDYPKKQELYKVEVIG